MEIEFTFSYFFKYGLGHILDVKAYDHLIFIITLCALYQVKEWKKVLILVTAFTIGHSVTLLTTTLGFRILPTSIVEILIPITIFITAIYNVSVNHREGSKILTSSVYWNYLIALFFGFIHGMGFANGFGQMMIPLLENQGSFVYYLFAFNLGIEFGQIIIVFVFFSLLYIISFFTKIIAREWNLFVSGAGAGIAIILLLKILFP